VSRCISELTRSDPERDSKQVQAICFSQWRQKEVKAGDIMHPDFLTIYQKFKDFFGDEDGITLYKDFLDKNDLDDTKPYSKTAQLKESFEWIEPRIKYWKQDREAYYFKVRAITANVSMNKTDYSDKQDIEYASSNVAWRPLNLDHNHGLRLSFPQNRIEEGNLSEEKNSIECVIRIHKMERARDTGELIHELIRNEQIVNPSIEAHPVCGTHMEQGVRKPTCGYYLDELSLLRKKHELPGDPLSKVFGLPLNEYMGESLIESIQDVNTTGEYKPKEVKILSDKPKIEEVSGQVDCKDIIAKNTDLTKELVALKRDCGENTKKRAEAEEQLSASKQKIITLEQTVTELEKVKDEVIDLRVKVNDYSQQLGELETLKAKEISNLERQKTKEFEEKNVYREDASKLRVERDSLKTEINNYSTKLATTTQEKINLENERNKLQLENANLHNDIAKSVRREGELSDRLSGTSVDTHKRETKITELQNEILVKTKQISKFQEDLKKAEKYQKWAIRKLHEAGVAIVDK